MKVKLGVLLIALLSTMVWAQDGGGLGSMPPPPGGGHDGPPGMHGSRPGFGTWWKNSDMATKLKLSDDQVKRLDETFYSHKMKLIDESADMQKADLQLRSLLEADNPDQSQVMAAVDQVLTARGKVERETTLMMLDFRKVLTVDQWKQLRAMHPMGPGFGGHGMREMRKHGRVGGPGGQPPAPPDGEPAPPSQD